MNNEKLKTSLKYRSYQLSLDIINLLEELPRIYIYEVMGKQLLRSATSIGANIIEAQAGSSRKDFINFYHTALKSANETKYWLAILDNKINKKEIVQKLLNEVTEISKILGASLITLKGKKSF